MQQGGLGLIPLGTHVKAIYVKQSYLRAVGERGIRVGAVMEDVRKWWTGKELLVCEDIVCNLLATWDARKVRVSRFERTGRQGQVIQGVETYPMYDWRGILGDFRKLRLQLQVWELVYRFMLGILASRSVLFRIGYVGVGNCPLCGEEETAFHAVYFCGTLWAVTLWLARVFCVVVGGNISTLRTLHFDVGGVTKDV